MEEEQAIIPGLPDDIAVDCIARVPHGFHPGLRRVSRRWRDLVTAPFFRRRRVSIGSAEDLIFLVQAVVGVGGDVETTEAESKGQRKPGDLRPPVYAISLYCPTDGSWHRLALPEPIPLFSQCAITDSKLVVLGGWDQTTLEPVADVRVLDLLTGEWKRGRQMSTMRSFFACAAVGGKVYTAGGHDEMKNALRTAEVYDVKADEWLALPPMSEERDECQGVAIGGEFWAISGYGTESQGRFESSVECFDPVKKEWVRKEGVWSEEWGLAACCGGGGAAGLWCLRNRGGRFESSVECFDPVKKEWVRKEGVWSEEWGLAACCGGGAAAGLWCLRNRGVREYKVGSGWSEAAPAPASINGCGSIAAMGGGKGVDRLFVMGGEMMSNLAAVTAGGFWILASACGGGWRRRKGSPGFLTLPPRYCYKLTNRRLE
ncbi:hypothetical protein HPP92_016125 [Vanilla planifolia]|uniref:F-box domain-containing protein n=1 Tax=Vanilla planifolia TaxID=51239 RepID=A0A835QF22_VANPL|nr:hypothetical protein HPP92_016125 [Vanilla planifolia]